MNTTPRDEGSTLARVLHGQVDGMSAAPLTFDAVAQRAGSIRRRRRIAVAIGVAAAAAVIVPSALQIGGGTTGSPEPDYIGPSPTTGQSPTGSAVRPFDISGLETGVPPAAAWADGTTIHRADGTTVAVTGVARIDALAPMGDGWLVATTIEENRWVVSVNADGRAGLRSRWPLDGSLVTSPSGDVVAWTSSTGTVTVVQSSGGEILELAPIPVDTVAAPAVQAAAVTSEDCSADAEDPCSVLVNVIGTTPEGAIDSRIFASSARGVESVDNGIESVTAARGPDLAGITQFRDDLSTCSAILSGSQGDVRWQTCDFRVRGFAPDGEHVVGVGSVADGLGDGELAILDATDGTPLVSLQSTPDAFTFSRGTVWEDEAHVLTVTFHEGQWAVVRIGVDGSMEYAVPPVPGEDVDPPFFLQVR